MITASILTIYSTFTLYIKKNAYPINKAYVAGLGGSGIGANFVAEFIRDESSIPYSIGKGYNIPQYVDKNTLAIISSYSGNTEETISSFEQILKRQAKVVIISSGGKLIEKAKELGLDYIKVPDDWPSPRACMGYSIVQQLFILHKLEIISDQAIGQIKDASELLNYDQEEIMKLAEGFAEKLHEKTAIIYTVDRMEAVAIRARQQINENAKMLCWHHAIPEMNHNELVGWRSKSDKLAVIVFRNSDDHPKNQRRIEISKEVIAKYTPNVYELYSKGNSMIERSMYFVHFGDWLSWYLSKLNGHDAIEIDVIDFLKSKLAD